MTIIKKVIIVLATVICGFTTVCQIFSLVTNYLQFNTSTATHHLYVGSEDLPAVTLCGPKPNYVTDKWLESDEGVGHAVDRPVIGQDSDTIYEKLSAITVKDQLEVMATAEDMKTYIGCRISASDGYPGETEDCINSMNIKVTINSDYFCTTLTYKSKDRSRYRYYGSDGYRLSLDYRLKVSDLLISLHTGTETIHDLLRSNIQAIHWEPKRSTNVYFQTHSRTLLSAPYGTCAHMTDHTYYQKDWIATINTDLWKKTVDCVPDYYLYNATETSKFCGDSVAEDKMKELKKLKYYRAKRECYRTDYHLTTVLVTSAKNKQDSHTINILPFREFNQHLVQVPVMPFGDMCYQVMQLVCLWLAGLALYLLSKVRLENTLTRVHSIK